MSQDPHLNATRPRRPRFGRRWLLGLVAVAVALLLLALLRTGPTPELTLTPTPERIGESTTVRVVAAAGGRGLGGLVAELSQGEETFVLTEQRFAPPPVWSVWGPRTGETTLELPLGPAHQEALTEGEATLTVTATGAGTPLRRGPRETLAVPLEVDTTAPRAAVTSDLNYLRQGGSGVVVYRVSETPARDGVRVGEHFFPGHPLPDGAEGERFALFAAPWDAAEPQVAVVVEDAVGNARETAFLDRYMPRPPSRDVIELSDGFLEKVVPAVLAGTDEVQADVDDLLAAYLVINGELRRKNAAFLADLAADSRPEFLWSEPFLALPGGARMAGFADRRTYRYQGRDVDQQTHLGYDLASVRRAPVPAANRGVVVWAEDLGIYGRTVVLDHGYGLLSLYAHLSSIDVETGETVERGATLGRTGETGLAGGDHLHFSMLLGPVQVDPAEWWDPAWIRDRIDRKLDDALPYEP